jgi:hypothetical protein
MNNDFPDDGGPHSSRCTGLSAFMAISNTAFTSSKPGAVPYQRDLKNIEVHLLNTGHFAFEEDSDLIA